MSYDLEPHEEEPDPGSDEDGSRPAGESPPDAAAPTEPAPTESAPIASGDEPELTVEVRGEPCPSCGTPLHESGALVCLGCGWDQRSLEQRSTEVGDSTALSEDNGEPESPAGPLVVSRADDRWLAPAIAVLALVVLASGILAGAGALFSHADREAELVAWSTRFALLGRLPVFVIVWTGCGLGALFVLSWLEVRPIGDMRALLVRLAAAVAVTRVAAWIEVSSVPFEFVLESIVEAGVFFVVVMALFRLRPRQASIVLAVTVGGFFLSLMMAKLITWAI